MRNDVSVSVALCTYNGERFVAEQLTSVLRQTRRPTEIVLADDGSTDDTLRILRAVAAKEDADSLTALRFLPAGPRLGVAANFERAAMACRSGLIALCDQDDVWERHRLERVAREFEAAPDLTLLHSDARLVDAAGTPLGMTLFEALEVDEADLLLEASGNAFDVLLRRNIATGATIVFRRSLLDAAAPFPSPWLHDEWLAMIAAAIGQVRALRDPLIDYRQHDLNQVGVAIPGFRRKVARVLAPRGERNRDLAERARQLESRLAELGSVPPARMEKASTKRLIEESRAAMPRNRLLRLPTIARLAATGRYREFCSQRSADILRDLLQPA